MTATPQSPRPALGERIVAAGLCRPDQVDAAIRSSRLVRGRLGYHLVRLGAVSAPELSDFLESEVASGRLSPPAPPAGAPGLDVLPARVAQLYNVYPLVVEPGRLELAVPPSAGQAVVEAVAACTGRLVEPRILPARMLRLAVERDYLGAASATVLPALAGLATFVVDDDLRGARPLAPELRTQDLSADAWLRSLVAEAVAAHRRTIELRPDDGGSAAVVVGSGSCWPVSRELAASLRDLVRGLAGVARREGRDDRRVGELLLLVRGRRLVATTIGEPDGTLRVVLADQRLAPDDADDLFATAPSVQDGVEAFARSGRGLVLLAGPAGGGARRVAAILGARLAEIVPDALRVADAAREDDGPAAAGDEAMARALHEAGESGASLVIADELSGPRSVERALLVAGRRRVLAVLSATDASAALAWLTHQGLAGALKSGLLRGIVSVLSAEAPCSCASPGTLDAEIARRWALADAPTVALDQGCATCLEAPIRRSTAFMTWTDVAGRPAQELSVEDEVVERALQRARGGRSTLDLVLEAAASRRVEMSRVLRLVAPPEP